MQEVEAGFVAPMEVFEEEEERPPSGNPPEDVGQRLEEPPLLGFGVKGEPAARGG
ncbi:MAG: hypothetical protein M5U01_24445 [Ardenticatenaceae bacterium]|nr:hypothetical protein [Ardenticatenaceae bacterium]